MIRADIRILKHLLENPARIAPWKIADLEALRISSPTAYSAMKRLTREGITDRVDGGWILSRLVLDAGSQHYAAIAGAAVSKKRSIIYGK